MWGINPPHTPYNSLKDCPEEDYVGYQGSAPADLLVRPNADTSLGKASRAGYYFASVTGVDRAFGHMLEALEEWGLAQHTLVIFSSDYGEMMCSQGVVEPSNSPYIESMNVPFLVRYPGKLSPRVEHMLLSSPDIMLTLLGLAGLGELVPPTVQGRDLASFFFGENVQAKPPPGVLYLQNVDGDKDAQGLVRDYIPLARGWKTHRYTLALRIDRRDHSLIKSLFFDDLHDPYQQVNLSLSDHPEIVKELCWQMGQKLKEIEDPWYTERVLGDLIAYEAD